MASSADDQILRAAKEIVVKFIETGRVSPTTFPEVFKGVYQAVHETVTGSQAVTPLPPLPTEDKKK